MSYSAAYVSAPDTIARIKEISLKWGLAFHPEKDSDVFVLKMQNGILQLIKKDELFLGGVYVDFLDPGLMYRRKFGGGRSQAIARAVGLKKNLNPTVLDATAGLGRDAFVLASLGCRVHMLERSPAIAALLEDGLSRADGDETVRGLILDKLSFSVQDSCHGLTRLPFKPDVVYLDPMFPEKKKSALVKKEMQALKAFIGSDNDSDELMAIALKTAESRVVVKRPVYAKYLADQRPDTAIKTKKNRFDVYLIK